MYSPLIKGTMAALLASYEYSLTKHDLTVCILPEQTEQNRVMALEQFACFM